MAKTDNEEVPQNLEKLAEPEPEMLGSASVDAPQAPENFFQRIRETYTNAKKAVQEFIHSEEDVIEQKEKQIMVLEAEIAVHHTNIDDAKEHLR